MYKPWVVVVAVAAQPSQAWRIGLGYLLPLLLRHSEAVVSYPRTSRCGEEAVAAQEAASCFASKPGPSRVLLQRGWASAPGAENAGDVDFQGDVPVLAPGFDFDSASVGQVDEGGEQVPVSRHRQRFRERAPLLRAAGWAPSAREDAPQAAQGWETEADEDALLASLPLEKDEGMTDSSGDGIDSMWNLLEQAPPNETAPENISVVNTTVEEPIEQVVVNTTVVNTTAEPAPVFNTTENATTEVSTTEASTTEISTTTTSEEPVAETDVTKECPSGSKKLEVANNSQFEIGDIVYLKSPDGRSHEANIVEDFGSIILKYPTKHAYLNGTHIETIKDNDERVKELPPEEPRRSKFDGRAKDFGDGVEETWHILKQAYKQLESLYDEDTDIMYWVAYIVFVPIYWALIILVARFYVDVKHHPPPKDPNKESQHGMWYYGLCSCYEVPGLSLFTFCCPAIRWADTIRMAGFLGYWIALLLFVGAESVWWLLIPLPITGVLVIGMAVYARQRMRKQFEMPFCTPVTVVADTLFHTFCQCCALVQEARQYEYAWACHDPAVTKGKGTS